MGQMYNAYDLMRGGSAWGGGGYYNAGASKAGVYGPSAMGYNPQTGSGAYPNQGQGGAAGYAPMGSPLQAILGKVDLPTMLAQILQAGPQQDQVQLSSALSDIGSQEDVAKTDFRNRFAGMGRPISSTEFTSGEQQLVNSFSRARDAARANASRSGLQSYQAQLNPLVQLLMSSQAYWPATT
jgi:hypothetical protein